MNFTTNTPAVPAQTAVNGTAPPPPLLTPAHWHMLTVESAIAPEVIAERGYQSLAQPADLVDRRFSKAQAKTAPALGLPVWDVHGTAAGWQIRPDCPRQLGDGKVGKYELPAKSHLLLDVHPRCQPRLGDPTVPLWITEGIKKGDALASHGACALALLGGVWGFRGTNDHGGKVILPDWQHVALNGRTVYVAFDSDLATKAGVQKALKALYTFLRSAHAIPSRVHWPDDLQQSKVGVDDYFAAGHSLDDLLAMIPPAGPLPTTPPHGRGGSAPAGGVTLALSRVGDPKPIVSNLLTILEADARWQGALQYNALTDDLLFVKRPPYLSDTGAWTTRSVDEQCDYTETNNWLQQHYGLCTTEDMTYRAMLAMGLRTRVHPIRDYLDGLRDAWDTKPRLDTWLHTYCHAEATAYTRAVGRKTLLAAVARIYQPGCKADTVCILEGKQGTYKSTVWRTLASDPWFSDDLPDLHDKDAQQVLRGKWIIEIGELAAFHRSEVEVIKRFVSKLADYYRNSYGRRATDHPRQNIFVATTNRKDYLKDDTGNRRFWPVALTGYCDTEALASDRNQLWAEAVHWYHAQAQWHLTGEEERLAVAQQAERLELDDWEPLILAYVESLKRAATNDLASHVTTKEILAQLFGVHEEAQLAPLLTQGNTKRVVALLQRNGWEPKTIRDKELYRHDKQVKAYARPVQASAPGTAVTADDASGNSESTSNDATVTPVTPVTPDLTHEKTWGGYRNTGIQRNTEIENALGVHANSSNSGNSGNSLPSERPPGASPPERSEGPREGLGASDVRETTERAAAAPAPPLVGGFSPSTTERQPPTEGGRIGSRGCAGQARACTVCGRVERWNDHGTLRCVACWPQARAVQP